MIEYGTDFTCVHGEPFDDCCYERPGAALGPAAHALASKLLTTGALDDISPPQPLIEGVLYLDSIAWLQGRPGSYKTFVAVDFAGSLATGENWQGHWVTGPHRVLYVVAEGVGGLRQRVRAWESATGKPMTGVLFLPEPVQAGEPARWDALVEMCESSKVQVIILDTQARLTVGMEENSARDMGIWVQQLERLRAATRACVLVVHHQGRTGEHMRGSTALEGAATTVIQVTKDDDIATVKCLKQKDAAEFDDILLRLVPRDDSAILALTDGRRSGSASEQARRWLAAWFDVHGDEWVSVSVLLASEVVSKTTFHRAKMALLQESAIERKGEGNSTRYRVLWRETGESHGPTLKGGGTDGTGSNSHGSPTGPWDSTENGQLCSCGRLPHPGVHPDCKVRTG